MKNTFSFFKKFGSHPHDDQVHPTRDWFTLLAVVSVIFVISMAWNAWLFIELANGKTLGKATETATSTQSQRVTDVQSIFQSRADTRVHFQTDYHFVDPSQSGS